MQLFTRFGGRRGDAPSAGGSLRRGWPGATLVVALACLATTGGECNFNPWHPPSQVVLGLTFDLDTLDTRAPGSDNWAITWAEDGNQYTTWGDGGGFGGTNSEGRVSMGVARIEGEARGYEGVNVWGGFESLAPATFEGKSYGILALGNVLYLWRTGEGSSAGAFGEQQLYVSRDRGLSFDATPVVFTSEDFGAGGFFAPTFLQFGQGYAGARDGYVYVYAPEVQDGSWEVQYPGEITLLRVPIEQIEQKSAYEFFAGWTQGEPRWSPAVAERRPAFEDPLYGVMRTSVSFNPGLGRYFLITQQVSRFRDLGAQIGIYEAPEPWGPWSTVLLADPWTHLGIQSGTKTVFWNFSTKWLGPGDLDLVLVFTGPGSDEWSSVEGRFLPAPGYVPSTP